MTRRLRFGTNEVFKCYISRNDGAAALLNSTRLSGAGVTTPAARIAGQGKLVAFRRIEGLPGMAGLTGSGMSVLGAMMKQTVALHKVSPYAGIGHFDPLKRIRPRMKPASETIFAHAIAEELECVDRMTPKVGLVHGDLHAGQFILDPNGQAWLLDFDDLAIAPAEADLGNFAAHLATRLDTCHSGYVPALRHWLVLTLKAYREAGGRADPKLAESFGRIALVRRALKLSERGDGSVEAALREEFRA